MNPLSLPPSVAQGLRESHWRLLVTGAGGWLGLAALESLAGAFGEDLQRRVVAFGGRERNLALRDGTMIRQRPLTQLPACGRAPSLLLHFAYLTRENASRMPAQAYIDANRAISRLAVEGGEAVGVERSLATSSGAVHAALASPDGSDPCLLYGRLKLEDEGRFRRFAEAEPGRRAFVARVFNLSGPYINKPYALASFIDQARAGRIVIDAQHPVVRSYTSVDNLLGVSLGQLLAEDAETHLCVETAGERDVEMGELARMVRDGVAPEATIERATFADAPVDRYVGNGVQYRNLLAAHGINEHALPRQIADTADDLAHRVVGAR